MRQQSLENSIFRETIQEVTQKHLESIITPVLFEVQ